MWRALWFALLAAALIAIACDSGRSETAPLLALDPAFGGRIFDRPIEVGAYPGDRLFVAEQEGLVTVLQPDGSDAATLLDIRELVDADIGEGLLSVSLDPAFEDNGHLWAYYYAAGGPRTILARFEVVDGRGDLETEVVVLDLAQPGANQNGGAIRFGPDGMLYLSLGDGSASFDPFDNGQDLTTLLGTIVRLDVSSTDAASPYVVPPDNPFLATAGARPEIWAFGLRNPWRMAFDSESGELWGGDVMVSDAEEINRYEAGGNYGWSIREGFGCLYFPPCESEGLAPPIAALPVRVKLELHKYRARRLRCCGSSPSFICASTWKTRR